ncbi:hypothetical protein NEFER03_2231 [Nematocida sp. LUAm3]|nr:hypothetical protein NEFER03_2231 [Nematocida sp. LUAm3]KAI5176365.1 hypothetical protein NEFER02_2143 [Nematocida sp. LUAm2]KAI5179381.1 hypothetical protein NEFER01_2213 [Nematocida sp. LUAm1]
MGNLLCFLGVFLFIHVIEENIVYASKEREKRSLFGLNRDKNKSKSSEAYKHSSSDKSKHKSEYKASGKRKDSHSHRDSDRYARSSDRYSRHHGDTRDVDGHYHGHMNGHHGHMNGHMAMDGYPGGHMAVDGHVEGYAGGHFGGYAGGASLSSETLKDGIAAVNVIGSYYDVLKKKSGKIPGVSSPIPDILVYPVGNNVYTDYWGVLKFSPNPEGVLMDESKYFQGIGVKSKEEIIEQGALSEIGFYQKRDLPENSSNQNYLAMKALIQEISTDTHKDVEALHGEKVGFGLLSGLQDYYENSAKLERKKRSCLTVCICSNESCSGPCKSIKCIEPMYLL